MGGLPGVTTSNLLLIDVDNWGDVPWSSMNSAFYDCQHLKLTVSFASDLPNLANVTDMTDMFFNCNELEGPSNMNAWDVSSVTDMSGMFLGTDAFNQPIGSWDVSSVTDMSDMFLGAASFNQPLGSWNTANVTDMSFMFSDASAFDQDLSGFELNAVSDLTNMLDRSGLSCVNYGRTLKGWADSETTPNELVLGAEELKYGPPASDYHNTLTESVDLGGKGWTINDAGEDAACNTALPVDFGSISGSFHNGQLQLNWSTLTETNTSHFEIEASTDGVSFTKVGEVESLAPNGNSDVAINYSFDTSAASLFFALSLLSLALGIGFKKDNRKRFSKMLVVSGVFAFGLIACNKADTTLNVEKDATIFVRIKQVDKDGSFKYSKTIKLANR